MSSSGSSSDGEPTETVRQRTPSPSGSDSAPSHRSPSPQNLPPARRSMSGSERSEATPPPARRNLIDSSDEEGSEGKRKSKSKNAADGRSGASALFGEDVSSDSDDAHGDARRKNDDSDGGRKSDSDGSIKGIRLYPDLDEEPEPEEEAAPAIIEAVVPEMNAEIAGSPYYAKLPNFLSIETRPFDQEQFEDNEDDDNIDDEGRSRLKLKVENTLRWRHTVDEDGNEHRESNAKIVRWSDGTMSLYLGNEIFEIQDMPLVAHTHLFVRHTSGLVGEHVFNRKLQFRPHSTDSKTHRKVTMNMADRTRKSGQVKMLNEVGVNPDEVKREAVRKEEELLRAAIRRETSTRSQGRRDRPRGLTSSFLEDRDDSDDDGRGRYRRTAGEAPLIGASSDESDGGRKLEGAKQDDSDSDEEFRKKKQLQKKKIMTSDEDSD